MRLRIGLALALVAAPSVRLAGQEPPPSPAPPSAVPQIFAVEASRVLLDVVVRDGKDNPVTDLEASDFEIYEDGVRQQVDLFEVIRAPGAAPGPEPEAAEPRAPRPVPRAAQRPEVALIAFVFDRLSADARSQARQAALTYLEGSRRDGDYAGVFLIDLSLLTLQNYTNDPERIRGAIEEAAGRATSSHASSRERRRELLARDEAAGSSSPAAPGGGGAAGGAAAGAAGAAAGAAAADAQFREMERRMLDSFEVLERDQQGYATSNGLLAVVNSLKLMPGRKSVVFFSEGLAIPPAVQAHFRAVISEANRANVSIYAMDAAGLRADSAMEETRREMLAQAREQARQRGSGRDHVGGALSKQLERNEDLLRLNPHSGLGQLANETGGFLIRDTNDLKGGFRRIDADMRFYYALAYEPSNQEYDGAFRNVEVKVRRPGVKVRSRRGYIAVRETDSRPVLTFEAPALALMDRAPAPDAFPTWTRALSFPEPDRPGLAPVLVGIPGNVLKFRTDEETKSYLADLVIVARIKDATGRVVERMGQNYKMSGPKDQLAAARAGEVLFYREAELAPGRYTVEAIAYDAEAEAAGMRTAELVVPEAASGRPRLSSVVPVKRVEQLPKEERDAARPLAFGDVLLYPNLGEPVSKADRNEVTFFFTVYGVSGGAERPRGRIALAKGGAKVAEAPIELPEPDSGGRIQHVLGLPLAQLPAGSYELTVTVEDARGRDSQAVAFVVQG